jgi:hypothetical protein
VIFCFCLVFFLLASPDDAARASISPMLVLDKSFQNMMNETVQGSSSPALPSLSTTTSSSSSSLPSVAFHPVTVSKDVSMDDLMAMATPPAKPKLVAVKNNGVRKTIAFAETPVANPLESVVASSSSSNAKSKGARSTVQWEKADVLLSPIADPSELLSIKLNEVEAVKTATSATAAATTTTKTIDRAANRNTVSFEPKQLEKFNELEKLKNSSMQDIAQIKVNCFVCLFCVL